MSPEHRRSYYEITTDTTWYALTQADVILLNEARTAQGLPELQWTRPSGVGVPPGELAQPVWHWTGHVEPVPECAVCAARGPHVSAEELEA